MNSVFIQIGLMIITALATVWSYSNKGMTAGTLFDLLCFATIAVITVVTAIISH